MTAQHHINHLCRARRVRHWQRDDRLQIIFTDESQFNLFKTVGSAESTEEEVRCWLEVVSFCDGSVIAWGGICGDQKAELVVIFLDSDSPKVQRPSIAAVVVPTFRCNSRC